MSVLCALVTIPACCFQVSMRAGSKQSQPARKDFPQRLLPCRGVKTLGQNQGPGDFLGSNCGVGDGRDRNECKSPIQVPKHLLCGKWIQISNLVLLEAHGREAGWWPQGRPVLELPMPK